MATALMAAIAACYFVSSEFGTDGQIAASSYFGFSPTRPQDSRFIPAARLGGSDYCGHCHTEIFHQWNASAHHFSSHNNPFYRKVVLESAARRDASVTKFCAGCHDPLLLLSGDIETLDVNRWSTHAGITCLACHRITEIHGDNGGYVVSPPVLHPLALAEHPALQSLHGMLLRATPSLHRAALSKPFYRSPAYCAACHSLTTPKAINGVRDIVLQDEHAHWMHSRFAHRDPVTGADPATCVDCHMPRVPSVDPAAKNGLVRSHRFVGGNTALPALNRDTDQLRAAEDFLRDRKVLLRCAGFRRNDEPWGTGCRYSHAAAGDTIELRFDVVNHGVGHTFPGGTVDSNESWLELEVRDRDGRLVFHRGFTSASGDIDDNAHFFRAVLADRNGRATDRRTGTTEAVSVVSNSVIPAGHQSSVSYRFKIPSESRPPFRATARIKWRKFDQRFTRWVFAGKDVPTLPVTVLDTIVIDMPRRIPPSRTTVAHGMPTPSVVSGENQ